MNIATVPAVKNISPYGGAVRLAPVGAVSDRLALSSFSSASDLFDRVFGLELKLEATVDESLFTPLGEPGARERERETDGDVGFVFSVNYDLAEGECVIDVDALCRVEASGAEGFFRAASIIAQISERTCDKLIELPRCRITDRPDSPFRALSLDVARRWHPVDYLYKYVDVCALYGINRFVLHFTDDESYTLPSRAYPLLPTDGRHYTEEELRALDGYAAARGVMIIPEIDMPGHSAQFSMKYPDIFGKCGIMEATEEVFEALGVIYREAAELFPGSRYIHIGGDEAVLGRWNDSPATAEYMNKNAIPDIVTLYGHFVGRVARDVLALGRTPMIWEGFGKAANGEVPREALIASFENHYQTARELVDAGFTVINASWRPLYCVAPWQKWSRDEILSTNRYTFDHWWDGSEAYNRGVTVPKGSAVAGGMYCAWGDYLKGYPSSRLACQLEFACVAPRLSAVAEILWNDAVADKTSYEAAFAHAEELLGRIHGENPFRGKL